jgi:hypothetical protein
MDDFCESYSPFHVCLTICPFAHLVYATSHLSHFIHIWYLDWPWSRHAHIMPISRMVDFCESCSPFHVCLTIRPSAHLGNRHNMRMPRSWPIKIPNMNKMRQMTSCVHKMCEWTYGQTNMKRAITLAKINHPWNRYTMPMLTSWPTKIPNMNKIKQFYSYLVSWLAMISACAYYADFTDGWFLREL